MCGEGKRKNEILTACCSAGSTWHATDTGYEERCDSCKTVLEEITFEEAYIRAEDLGWMGNPQRMCEDIKEAKSHNKCRYCGDDAVYYVVKSTGSECNVTFGLCEKCAEGGVGGVSRGSG